MSRRDEPPRIAHRLLIRRLPPEMRSSVEGDLEEVFRRSRRRHGALRARLAYWKDALALLARLGIDRFTRRGRRMFAGPSGGDHRGRDHRGRNHPATTRGDGGSPSLLDVKLGVRMLWKYPWLTLIGGLGMAVAIAVGVGYFAVVWHFLYPTLPIEDGDRLVGLENWDVEVRNEDGQSLHDFFAWRQQMETVQQISAFRHATRNLIDDEGGVHPVLVAAMTASGFEVARTPPLMGRYLVAEDERPEAPPVAVIGYSVWQARFGGEPDVVGRQLRFGETVHTIVGVMPEDYAFPLNHAYWTPFRWQPGDLERGSGPWIFIFGRLADGVTREQAQAELTTIGERATAAWPETHGDLRPMVWPYTYPLTDIQGMSMWDWEVGAGQLVALLLLLIVSLNVAVLSYARTATRQGEIAVRSALGASRGRIVLQLFVEALVLSSAAALVGLALAYVGVVQADLIMQEELGSAPFWGSFDMNSSAIPVVIVLTMLAALIVGVVPGLQATGRGLKATLAQLGGSTGLRLGRTWSVLIVAQVAIAVCGLSLAVSVAWDMFSRMANAANFSEREILTASVAIDATPPPGVDAETHLRELPERFAQARAELRRRLEADPLIAEVTFADRAPGSESWVWLDVDGVAAEHPGGHYLQRGAVDPGIFDALDIRVLAGRTLAAEDTGEAGPVAVNRAFVEQILGGDGALGQRVREAAAIARDGTRGEPGPWRVIVGVVDDFYSNSMHAERITPTIYQAISWEESDNARLVLLVRDDPDEATGRLRRMAVDVDPSLRLSPRTLMALNRQNQIATRLIGMIFGFVTLSVLLLCAAGIYALMSFAVTRRHREIGIRTALGAHPLGLLASIFSRVFLQICAGIAIGVVGALVLASPLGAFTQGADRYVVPAISLLVVVVGLLAAVGPARRGLRIDPTEALRAE